MTGRFHFDHERRDDVEVTRWLGDPEVAGWARHDLWGPGTPRFVEQYTMTGGAGLLYPALLGLVWHLTDGLQRFVLPVWDGVADCERAHHPYELVPWEYRIEWEQADWQVRDRGFVPAEHYAPTNGSAGRTKFQTTRGAALAPVRSWAELMAITPFGDQANTLCLFSVDSGDGARDRLLTTLRAESPPRVDEIVEADDDILAVITHEDEGLGLSSLVIYGRGRLRRGVSRQAALLNDRVANYLSETKAAKTHEEWLSAVDRLADLAPEEITDRDA